MDIKSISDFLNFIDSMILCSIEKHVGIGNLKSVLDHTVWMYNDECIEEMVVMTLIFSQINLIMEKFYLDNESDIKKQYCVLKKRKLDWLEECNTKPEADNQQNSYLLTYKWL